jgi:prephenate dehydratase
MQEFDHNRINLTKIESRPTKEKPWEYNFYVDFEGHIEEDNVIKAINNIEKKCTFVKILGSYPRGTIN